METVIGSGFSSGRNSVCLIQVLLAKKTNKI